MLGYFLTSTHLHVHAHMQRPMLLHCTLMLPTAKIELILRLNLQYLKHLHCVRIYKDISLKAVYKVNIRRSLLHFQSKNNIVRKIRMPLEINSACVLAKLNFQSLSVLSSLLLISLSLFRS